MSEERASIVYPRPLSCDLPVMVDIRLAGDERDADHEWRASAGCVVRRSEFSRHCVNLIFDTMLTLVCNSEK